MVNTIICCAIGSKSRFTCFYKSWIRQNAPPRIPLRVKIRGTKEYAGVVELVDSVDLGSSAKACRFESCRPHQTNIIRTKFSLWETGSDYLFSLAGSRKPISETVLSSDQNQSPEGQEKRNRFRGTLLWIRKLFPVRSISTLPVSKSGL